MPTETVGRPDPSPVLADRSEHEAGHPLRVVDCEALVPKEVAD